MTGKERVMAAFQHRTADRVPAWCGASAEFWAKAKRYTGLDDEGLRIRLGDDFRRVYAVYAGPDRPLSPGATWRSPFGIERTGIGYGQPLAHPLADAKTEDAIHAYDWPDPDWMDVSRIKADAEQWNGVYAILGGEWCPIFHDAIDFLGMEKLYYAMYDTPSLVHALMGHLTDFYFEVSRRTFDAASRVIDIFFIGNDLGSQTGPLLGTELFREFVLPYLKRFIDLGHDYGLKVMMHCCGGFRPLIPLLIEAGLDGLHALQPNCAGMESAGLKRDFGDKIVLNGAIDSHHVLIDGPSPDFVRAKTKEVLDIMAPQGGYIASASHDTILEETPVENVLAMFDTIAEYRVQQKA